MCAASMRFIQGWRDMEPAESLPFSPSSSALVSVPGRTGSVCKTAALLEERSVGSFLLREAGGGAGCEAQLFAEASEVL